MSVVDRRQINEEEIERHFLDALRREGERATPQRLEVLREVIRAHDHPSAEMVYQRVRKRLRTISRDTVYRTLNWLEERGLIVRAGVHFGSARFEALCEPHHHFLCKTCGLILDVTSTSMDIVKQCCEMPGEYEIHTARIELQGICPNCQKKQ